MLKAEGKPMLDPQFSIQPLAFGLSLAFSFSAFPF